MKKRRILLTSLCCALTFGAIGLVSSCNQTSTDILDKNIVIEGPTELNVGEGATLVAKAGGVVLEGVTWTSSDKKVAFIDSALGELTTISAGTTTITCTKENYLSATLTILVKDVSLPSLVIVNSVESSTIKQGETLTLTLRDSSGNEITGAKWTSSDPNIALVSQSGLVSGRTAGKATITASKTGYNSASIEVTILESTVTPPEDVYAISYKKQTGVVFDGPTSAKANEKVEFSVSTTSDSIEITEVRVNGQVKNKINDKYTFTMPAESVLVEASIVIGDAEVSVGGDATFPLVLNSEGIYESEPITLEAASNLTFYVNVDGQAKALAYRDPWSDKYKFDFRQCFAHIESSSTEQFRLDGGYSYIFYYNPTTTKCYVKRDQVVTLPQTPEQFETLFDAGSTSTISTYPENVTSVTYRNSKTNEDYSWEKYKDNVSIASVQTLSTGTDGKPVKVGDVFKEIKGDKLRVVDTYVETKNYQTTDHEISNDQRNEKYSGLYNIYDSVNDFPANSSRYSYTREDAEFFANMYSHDYYSLELDFYEAYRGSFAIEDTLKFASREVSSVSNTSGGFTTTVDSNKTYVDSSNASNNVHYEYDLAIDFDSKGRMLAGRYLVTAFKEDAYDFSNNKFLLGGQEKGTISKDIAWSYEYGTETKEAPAFDYSKYFINNITSLRVNNKSVNSSSTGNVIKKGDIISIDKSIVSFEYENASALDYWQYGIVASSDKDVIAPRNNSLGEYEAIGFGTSTLTFGNHTTNDVTYDVNVEVQAGIEPFYWFFDCSGQNGARVETAHKAVVYQGESIDFRFKTSPSGSDNSINRIELSDTRFFTVQYDSKNDVIHIVAKSDAFSYTVPKDGIEITLNIYSTVYKGGETPCSVNKIVLMPGGPFSVSQMTGTWVNASKGYSATFTTESITYKQKTWNKGVIVAGTEQLVIGWMVDSIGFLDYTVISYTGKYIDKGPGHSFEIMYDSSVSVEEQIAIAWTITWWGGLDDIGQADIIGYIYEDEGYVDPLPFTKQA